MLQLIFSPRVTRALEKLPLDKRMSLLDQVADLNFSSWEELDQHTEIGSFERDTKTYYRLRLGDVRLYMERTWNPQTQTEILYGQHLISRNSLTDFAFRTAIPLSQEQLDEHCDQIFQTLSCASPQLGQEK